MVSGFNRLRGVVRPLSRFVVVLVCIFLTGMAPHDDGNSPKSIDSASPPGVGGDGPWDAENMELLGRLTLEQLGTGGASNVLGSDCWGWTDPQDGTEYAIVGLTNGTAFVDISDPRNPVYLGTLPTQTGNAAWRDMKVYANHCFIVSDGNGAHGMQVFDLTQLRTASRTTPTTFTNTAWYGGITRSHNIAINEDTGFAYLVGTNVASGGLHVVDLSNPAAPVAAGNFSADGYTHDVQVVVYHGPDPDHGGQEIAFACNEDTVTIVNVNDKSNMTMISRNPYAQDQYTHQGWLSEDHRYFYMGDELDESQYGGLTRTHIFDCQDLDNPVYLGYFSGATPAIDHNMYVRGNYLYQANYAAGLRVLEIGANQADLTEVAHFDTFNTDTAPDFDGAWSCYPYFDSGTVLVNDRQNGMFLVRLLPIRFTFLTERPHYVDSQGGVAFTVRVDGFSGAAEPGTGVLHVDRGNGYESFPMTEIAPNTYEAVFPPTPCGQTVTYYVSATATDGTEVCSPTTAPAETYSVVSLDGMTITFADDFETNQGWTVSGDATDGHWTRGTPAGGGDRGDPPTDGDGSGRCFVTDNADGNSDVDGGATILTSPVFDATGPYAVDAALSYWRWYSNDFGAAPAEDVFEVEVSNDGGTTWVNLETVGPSGREVSGGWYFRSFLLADVVELTSQMQVRFIASDLNDGSVVEAAVDGVELALINCADQVIVDSFNMVWGDVVSGTVSDLDASDDQKLVLKTAQRIGPGIIVELDFLSTTLNPSLMRLNIESTVNRTRQPVQQIVSLYNFVTQSYEQLDDQELDIQQDRQIVITPDGDVTRFVEPVTGLVRAKVQFKKNGRFFVGGYRALIDAATLSVME